MHVLKEGVEDQLIEDISVNDCIDRLKLIELLDIYQFMPIRIYKDKNKSEDVYFIMNSNKRGAAQNKE